MNALSFIILIFLSLLGYSAGATAKARKTRDLKPQFIDLIVILLIWGAAIYARLTFNRNGWRLIVLCSIASFMIGFIVTSFRKLPIIRKSITIKTPEKLLPRPKRIWNRWKDFSLRMGSFQSRVLLSFFFFILVSPICIAVKTFSDPLRIKPKNVGLTSSHWLIKKAVNTDNDQYRRQF